jgi:hypothetical protein
MRLRALLALLVLAGGGGCILPQGPGRVSGRSVGDHRRIVPGVTTKADLIEWLGAPMAIAGSGEYVEVPAANVDFSHGVLHAGSTRLGGGSWTQQGDAWLAPFAARRTIGPAHRVYYWYTTRRYGIFLWPVVFLMERSAESSEELWVLVDEERDVALDSVHRER